MSQIVSHSVDFTNGLQLVGAIDQGTSSSRFLIFNAKTAELLTFHQKALPNYYPKDGWIEQNPMEILETVDECIRFAVKNLEQMNISKTCIKTIGITNQRETTIVWDRNTGKPLHNAIVWCDIRTQETVEKLIEKTPDKNADALRSKCGLPISTYFSAVKLRWLMDNNKTVSSSMQSGDALFGTVDSWLLWNYTGGASKGKHITDVTNASRTMLLNITTQTWDSDLLDFFEIPHDCLPGVRSCAEHYGDMAYGVLKDVPICGCLGDQHAALVGQNCFKPGDAKNTYGTGCFLLQNVGKKPVMSKHGLLSTIGYKLGKQEPTFYALEGSVAVAGSLVQWLRDNLGLIKDSADVEELAKKAGCSGGMVIVPAFSGLYAPHWRSDARGTVCGLTQFHSSSHFAFAVLEAVCFQTREIIEAMRQDSKVDNVQGQTLQVDGGMTNNRLLMQLQADILGFTVLKPAMPETTALGAAMAAGKACGIWSLQPEDLTTVTFERFEPIAEENDIKLRYAQWNLAVEKSKGWHFSHTSLGNFESSTSIDKS